MIGFLYYAPNDFLLLTIDTGFPKQEWISGKTNDK